MQGARDSTESMHKALRINLGWNKQRLSHFHGHMVHIEACELRVHPTEPSVPTNRSHSFLKDTLGVGFRPYPKGEMHVGRAKSGNPHS